MSEETAVSPGRLSTARNVARALLATGPFLIWVTTELFESSTPDGDRSTDALDLVGGR